jgi:hypothetical protein
VVTPAANGPQIIQVLPATQAAQLRQVTPAVQIKQTQPLQFQVQQVPKGVQAAPPSSAMRTAAPGGWVKQPLRADNHIDRARPNAGAGWGKGDGGWGAWHNRPHQADANASRGISEKVATRVDGTHRLNDARISHGVRETRLDTRLEMRAVVPIVQTMRPGAGPATNVPRDLKNGQPGFHPMPPATVLSPLDNKTQPGPVTVSLPGRTGAGTPAGKIEAVGSIGKLDRLAPMGKIDRPLDKVSAIDRSARDMRERMDRKERLDRVERMERPGGKPKGHP